MLNVRLREASSEGIVSVSVETDELELSPAAADTLFDDDEDVDDEDEEDISEDLEEKSHSHHSGLRICIPRRSAASATAMSKRASRMRAKRTSRRVIPGA